MLYSLDEICLIPAAVTCIKHRSEINVQYEDNTLPIFNAPMSCIIDENNYKTFKNHNINTIIPRTVPWKERVKYITGGIWTAIGLSEAKYLLDNMIITNTVHICIDQANGHMQDLLSICKKLKDKHGNKIQIMTGNIANPMTYYKYAEVGIDYVRCGIGGGSRCTTSVQTGIHYPMASLIAGCNIFKLHVQESIRDYGNEYYKSAPKIIADGGINHIDHIVKALALGADYVMLGKMFAKTDEAAGEIIKLSSNYKYREYFGMSTEKAQALVNAAARTPNDNFIAKHSEGVGVEIEVDTKLDDLIYDITHALKSCMSYCNKTNINEFIGNVEYEVMSNASFAAYIK